MSTKSVVVGSSVGLHARPAAIIAEAADLVASEKLHVPVAAVYAIDDVGQAIEHVQKGGKALLKLGV